MRMNMKIRVAIHELRYQFNKYSERAAIAIVWAMPDWVVKWCAVRAVANATTGQYSGQEVGELSAMTAIQRWPA